MSEGMSGHGMYPLSQNSRGTNFVRPQGEGLKQGYGALQYMPLAELETFVVSNCKKAGRPQPTSAPTLQPTSSPTNAPEVSTLCARASIVGMLQCNQEPTLTRCYKKTADGASSDVWHAKCDGKGPTITVMKGSSGYTFGGYTGVSWQKPGGIVFSSTPDATAFLFTDTGRSAGRACQFEKKTLLRSSDAIRQSRDYGPAWGSGPDLMTSVQGKMTTVTSQTGSYYMSQNAFGNNFVTPVDRTKRVGAPATTSLVEVETFVVSNCQ
jgi:hypothetical protein